MKQKEVYKVGQMIHIYHLTNENDNHYDGREGKIEFIDSLGQLHGTWGGLAVIPEADDFEVMKKCSVCGNYFIGYGNNAYPINEGECCNKCNIEVVARERFKRANKK